MAPIAITPSGLAALLLAALLVGACGEARPTPAGSGRPASAAPASSSAAPSTAAPSSSAAPSSTSSPAASAPVASPGGAPDRPDLAAVAVRVEPLAEGLDQPVFVTGAGDGSGRLFVAEQPGRIRVVKDGTLSPTPFLDITDRVTSGGERGLLGVAFPPGFGPARPVVYIHYSGAGGATVVSEVRLDAHDPTVLDPATERVVFTEPQPYANHNGGWIGFDSGGMLLIALGDGGSGGDPENRASSLSSPLGKILRIDVTDTTGAVPYAIPADNPFAGDAGARPEILYLGLRNPFRASMDPATGNLWIGDVGQGDWEEVDVAPAGSRGLDFGWRRWEGRHCYDPSTDCDPAGVTMPVTEYDHGAGCSVIGGVVYHGAAIPALRGGYLFGDYCSGTLWAIDAGLDAPQAPITLLETRASLSSIGTGDEGEVYLTDVGGGRVLRLLSAGG